MAQNDASSQGMVVLCLQKELILVIHGMDRLLSLHQEMDGILILYCLCRRHTVQGGSNKAVEQALMEAPSEDGVAVVAAVGYRLAGVADGESRVIVVVAAAARLIAME